MNHAGAVLGVLQQSLAGWEALETDLLEAANLTQQAAELSEHVRSATQVVVDAVLDLLDGGVFRSLLLIKQILYVTPAGMTVHLCAWHKQASSNCFRAM